MVAAPGAAAIQINKHLSAITSHHAGHYTNHHTNHHMSEHSLTRPELRFTLRQQRKAVTRSTARAAADAVARHLARRIVFKGQRIAVYSAFDGEIDVTPVVRQAQRAGCVVYVPRIVNMRTRQMAFVELVRQHLAPNNDHHDRPTMREPRSGLQRRINPRLLDVVLVPLVAFDVHGWRLGFGAGFYDRKFSFRRRQFVHKPLLIGVGYEFQRIPPQIPSAWDVLLDAVVTERGLRQCRTQYSR
jgi:5-formyltetrahydrofolate cyclo-ligase